jgi:hypothetical protein
MLRGYTVLFMLGIVVAAAGTAIAQQPNCWIQFGAGGMSRTFYLSGGAVHNNLEGPWDFIRKTYGPCTFQVFNQTNLSGKSVVYGTAIDKRIRIGETGGQDDSGDGWGARSLHIVPAHDTRCYVILGDNGISQTFYGPDEVKNISGWNFVRESAGGCSLIVFNGSHFDGRQEEFLEDVTGEDVRVGWRIRSLKIED